ncbi:MAG: hypothetical protein IMZ50_02720 [Candidatus Atribacteria bacterium]|nr:hypothetical protein [Candidatus Atribacteria bacterium]
MILSIILVFYFYFMIYKDQIIDFLVKMMVDESLRYGMDFPKVYASFGAAIIIIIFMLVSSFLLYRHSSSKVDLSQGLAEIAYRLEHLPVATNASSDEPGHQSVATDPNRHFSIDDYVGHESELPAADLPGLTGGEEKVKP